MEFKKLSKLISELYPNYKDKVSLKICSGFAENYLIMFQPSTTLTYSRQNGMGISISEEKIFNEKLNPPAMLGRME